MPDQTSNIVIPRYYAPRPYQREAWARRNSGKYRYNFDCQHRQSGKDTDYLEYGNYYAYHHPGTQSVYIGLDNKWIKRNIWNKYLDGRYFWADYYWPDRTDIIDVQETKQQVVFPIENNDNLAPAIIQFMGFKESSSVIGSSYDNFYISELSLYRRGAFDLVQPIWDRREADGDDFYINMNFTPRGMSNIAADMLKAYTGIDDPEGWPGAHGNVYVNLLPANKTTRNDGTRLFTDEMLERIRDRYVRAMGNDLLFRQEYMCEFLAVNAGLVFPGIELLRTEKRYTQYRLDPNRPVYAAWDISSKDKTTDWTSAVIFQYYNGRMFIYDYFEDNRKSVLECVQELAKRDYFYLIRACCLPWDSDRSGSSSSPLEECRKAFPNIDWHKLERRDVKDGIDRARQLLGNAIINSLKCDWLMECFENWEFKRLEAMDDWAAKPKHNRYSHLMDAFRYAAEFINQVPYLESASGKPAPMPSMYASWDLEDEDPYEGLPVGMRPSKFSKPKIIRDGEYTPWL